MTERINCLDCKVSRVVDMNLVSGAAAVILAEQYVVNKNRTVFRQARDMYSLFNNTSSMLTAFINNGTACEKCEYMDFVNNYEEE